MTTFSKRDLRRAARERRRRLTSGLDETTRVRAGETIAAAVLALVRTVPLSQDGRPTRVAAYESLPDEPPTGPLITALVAAGHEVIVPVTLDDFSLDWVAAVPGTVADATTVKRASPPTAEPDAGRAWLGPDTLAACGLVVTPGLTVDRHGTRLGQGGGCYDRALVHRDRAALVVTLLHEGEFSETDLPRDAHDAPVDGWISTSGRFVRVPPPTDSDPAGASR